MISEICPTTKQACKYRVALRDIEVEFIAYRPKKQAEFDALREDKLEAYIEQAERACDEEYCGIDLFSTALSFQIQIANETASQMGRRRG